MEKELKEHEQRKKISDFLFKFTKKKKNYTKIPVRKKYLEHKKEIINNMKVTIKKKKNWMLRRKNKESVSC